MSIFYAHLHDKDIEVLNLYLSGMSDKDIIAHAYPNGRAASNGKTAYDNTMRRLKITLRLPAHKKLALANKDKILKNLDIHIAHVERVSEFNDIEKDRVRQEGFTDLRHVWYDDK